MRMFHAVVLFVVASSCAFSAVEKQREPEHVYPPDYPTLLPICSEEEACERYNHWIIYLRKHVQPQVEMYMYHEQIRASADVIRQKDCYKCEGPYGTITLFAETGQLLSWAFHPMANKIFLPNKKQRLTPEQAIERAKEYTFKLRPDFRKLHLRFDKGERYTHFEGGDSYGASWIVYAFLWVNGFETLESVGVTFEEDMGLYNFVAAVYLDPTYTEQKVTKEEALEIARPYADKVLAIASAGAFGGWTAGYRVKELKGAELKVVTPTGFFEPGAAPGNLGSRAENRLAWHVTYVCEHKSGELEEIWIWVSVDAGTGEVIDGGF